MKLNLDLNVHFWLGLVIFLATAISSGTIHLTNAFPDNWIPYVTAWSSIVSIVGSGYLTAALGLHNADPQVRRELVAAQPNTMVVTTERSAPGTNRTNTMALANKLAAMPEVQNVISTAEIAMNTPSPKIVSEIVPETPDMLPKSNTPPKT